MITVGAMSFFTFIVSLGILSIFPHQEPRFLIPLTVPIGKKAQTIKSKYFEKIYITFHILSSHNECPQVKMEMWKI